MESVKNQQDWTQVSEVEITYKAKVKPSQRPVVKCSSDMYELLKSLWNDNTIELQEEFKVILLNRTNKVLGIYNASSGGISGTVADPKLILVTAIKAGACSIVLSHNHPSGSVKPSHADAQLTRKIAEAAKYLDMSVLDHLIITTEKYFSFADEGLL
ncbi:MAG: JAB domain-containing protein [Chitinophagaceae bacterium]